MSMAEFVTVGTAGDLSEGEMRAFEVGGRRVTVARVSGSLHAFDDTCTHRQCSLADGDLEEATVTCPCHGSQFDVTTGEVLNPPATEPVPVFPLRVEDDEIQVEV
jgi:3-phenylpropionate/trans-cinnamate dioxygenase ferredoxin component